MKNTVDRKIFFTAAALNQGDNENAMNILVTNLFLWRLRWIAFVEIIGKKTTELKQNFIKATSLRTK